MIPVLNWNTIIFGPVFKEVRQKLISRYCSEDILRKAFRLISPVEYDLNIPAERVLIQYVRYDQLTPSGTVAEYAEKRGIDNVHGYPESHATIFLNSSVYKDYAEFLKNKNTGEAR